MYASFGGERERQEIIFLEWRISVGKPTNFSGGRSGLASANTAKMAFSFNFGGEDIDETVDRDVPILDAPLESHSVNEEQAPLVNVRQHDLRELVGFQSVVLQEASVLLLTLLSKQNVTGSLMFTV